MIVTTSSVMPMDWRVYSIEAIIPLAMTVGSHILYPSELARRILFHFQVAYHGHSCSVVLNPWLVHFTF